MKTRYVHIDIAKGIAILFVVFSHNWILAYYKGEIIQVAYSFPVLIFFLLSGVFFNATESFGNVVIQKADALLKPYFVTLIFTEVILHLFTNQDKALSTSLFGVFYGNGNLLRFSPLWFLPNLFVDTLFAWLFIRLSRMEQTRSLWYLPVLLILMDFGNYHLRDFWGRIIIVNGLRLKELGMPFSNIWGLPFGIDLILITGVYFLLGYLLRPQIEKVKFNGWLFSAAFILFCVLNYFSKNVMDLNNRKYGEFFSTTAIAFLGIYMTFLLAEHMSRSEKLSTAFAYLGENSLIIYLFHTPFQEYSFRFLNVILPSEFINAIMAYFIGLLMPLVLLQIIKRVPVLSLLILPIKSLKRSSSNIPIEQV